MSGLGARAISRMLLSVVDAAERAGALLVAMQRAGGLNTRAKDDGTPVTLADRAAHDLLAGALPAIAPHLVVSEESAPAEIAERLRHARVWIVDPLDGTRSYIRGSPEYTVNIALVEDGRPVLGVVIAPALGRAYFAERGGGAFRRLEGHEPEPIVCRGERTRDDRIVVSGSDRHVPWSRRSGLAGVRVEAISSSVKLGLIAEGSALAYPRLTPSSEWDIAAGHAVVLEAGGWVVGTDGRELLYNKTDALNSAFLATASPPIAAAYAEILAPSPRG